MRTRLHFLDNLDHRKTDGIFSPSTTVLIYDRKLATLVPGFRSWLKRYPFSFPVDAGEKLKSLPSFMRLSEKIHREVGQSVTRSWQVVAIGGGSVGDFAGFFASVYKRGLPLVHLPTTWLAAIDSSHGGKTALNLSGAKNQIGTFYPSRDTILVRSVLRALPLSNIAEGLGELAKIALIDARPWVRRMKRPIETVKSGPAREAQSRWLWRNLPAAIDAKLRVVRRDPFETRGDRQILNLGHTFGHVLEAELGLSHGQSVGLGLLFAVDFSEISGVLSARKAEEIRTWLAALGITRPSGRGGLAKVSRSAAERLLRSDKKRESGNFVWFIVLRGFGKAERRLVDVEQILEVAAHTGWLR